MRALIGFAGFGGPEIVLREFGIEAVGIEIDNAIAEVNRRNGGHCLTADFLDIDPADYVGWFLYHFSPPCPSFSVANSQGAGETDLDLAMARKIAEFIIVGQPRFLTLENVWLYRKSQSWSIILEALQGMGYGVDWWHLNAANYGIPQSRKRMIVIARWDGQMPAKPWPTHSKKPDMFTKSWVGWYSAIEDLIPDLPDSQFAPWQLERLPDEMKCRAFLIPGDNTSNSTVRNSDDPINSNQTGIKALIVDSANSNSNNGKGTVRNSDKPMFTVTTNEKTAFPKAFIVGGQHQAPKNGNPRTVQNKDAGHPIWTICASGKLDTRAWVDGKVVSMTPRCLARFQDFPDSFMLPDNRALACRGIGNALPPGMYRAVLKSLGIG